MEVWGIMEERYFYGAWGCGYNTIWGAGGYIWLSCCGKMQLNNGLEVLLWEF